MKDLNEQIRAFRNILKGGPYPSDSPLLPKARDFLHRFPALPETDRKKLREEMHVAFSLPKPKREPFEELIPSRGWFKEYYEYTLQSEPPAVFHFMCAATVLGAAMERNVYLDKGFYRVYTNMATVLIAPTGRCRKTGATNTSLSLARAVEVNVLSERITPEALVLGLGGRETASGLIYAPELAVFLGRSKYLEGMVPLLTSLFDCPSVWASRTIGRGAARLTEVALSLLGASTMEWFREALPHSAFSGGFMARILFVAQERTEREFAFPEPGSGEAYERLREQLLEMRNLKGEIMMEPSARDWYLAWYAKHRKVPLVDAKFAGYHARKPDHLIRMAVLLRVAEARSLTLMKRDFEHGVAILDWLEARLPQVFEAVSAAPEGVTHLRILHQLRAMGGKSKHSTLMRQNSSNMNARQFRDAIDTLIQSDLVTEIFERPNTHEYHLTKEGEK